MILVMGSHVMQYGDVKLNKENLFLYMGSNPANDNITFIDSNSLPPFSKAVNQRDADLVHFWHKITAWVQKLQNMEERLKSLLVQLQTESGILDRIVYKGKNQHRRCLYFQYVLKVRRDVRLLLSSRLEEILNLFFQVLNGNKPNQTVQLLESLKKTKRTGEPYNFKERLLGVAHLLSQMVEPMVMAATEISSLLARSFFMGFSLTILALLARLRVLVQQILLDTVSVFNLVSSLSQKEHSIKLNQEGIEVFREYYPSKEDVKTLECVWRKNKFVLLERANKNEIKNQDRDCGVGSEVPLQSAKITYERIEALLGDDELGSNLSTDNIEELPDPTEIKRRRIDSPTDEFIEGIEIEECRNDAAHEGSPDENITVAGGLVASPIPLPSPKSPKLLAASKTKVAFVSVSKPIPSQTDESRLPKKVMASDWLATTATDKEDPFFSLLTGGHVKNDSLF